MSNTPKRNEPVTTFERPLEPVEARPEWALSDERLPLFDSQLAHFARHAGVGYPIDPAPQQVVDKLAQGRRIGISVSVERSGQNGKDTRQGSKRGHRLLFLFQ